MILGSPDPLSAATASSSRQIDLFTSGRQRISRQEPEPKALQFFFFHHASSVATIEDPELGHILQLTKLLVPPTAFAHGQGQAWKHNADTYPTLLEWRQVTVPHTLAKLSIKLEALLDRSGPIASEVEQVIAVVVCILARYSFPLPASDISENLMAEDLDHEGWTTRSTCNTALKLLTQTQAALSSTRRRELAQSLLGTYVRPIFASASSSTDPVTGRKKMPAPGSSLLSPLDSRMGSHRHPSADDDDGANSASAWKGLSSMYSLSVDSANSTLATRNEAIGCTNVLHWCISTLRTTSQSDTDWEAVWPLVLPPLLTIMEDSDPRFRVKGVSVVLASMLGPPFKEGVPGPLLIKTGIGVLFEQVLRVNLTFLHDAVHGPSLLYLSTNALQGLIMRTTDAIICTETNGDGGRKRFDAICNLISQSILTTWSYLSIPPSGTVTDRLLTRITCRLYQKLAADLVPEDGGVSGVKRFQEVSLEWLFGAYMSTCAFLSKDEVDTTIIVVQTALFLLKASSVVNTMGDTTANASVTKLCGRIILPGLCKCWISFRDSTLSDCTPFELQMSNLTAFLVELEPSFLARFNELVKLDSRLSELLGAA